ncbi:MAG: hypothetical protein A2Z83_05220 [Omnitrophica bacterium GWA2_52_8]|nr:MAG: hypothetical protein A2Z83_05220 [Omnitrophica bacterium GWA2_52_8]
MAFYLIRKKRVYKKVLVGTSLFFIGIGFSYLLAVANRRYFSILWLDHPIYPFLLMTLISILAYKPLDRVYTKLFKNVLFKSKSYPHIALMNFAKDAVLVLDLKELANMIVNSFGEILRLKTVALLVPNRERGDFEIVSANGWNVTEAKRVRLNKESPLIKLIYENGPHVLVRDRELRALSWQEANQLAHDFNNLRASWIIPLMVKEEFAGALAFASWSPEQRFDEADFQFFLEFGRIAATCVRNALEYSQLKSASEELKDAQSSFLQSTKLQAIEQLATGIAHEIHNPLTIISGKAQVLLLQKEKYDLPSQVEEVLRTIVKQTKRAADITKKLLMFSQGTGAPKEELRLDQVLDDTLALVSYQTSLDGIEIRRVFGKAIPTFYGNVHELREVFLNLILNAVQSVESGGMIRCEINYRISEQVIEVAISDTGKGIPAEAIDKLFDPFFTTRQDGVGLGLFVARQIVRRYGGCIRVESEVGKGSLFLVRLPYDQPRPEKSAEAVSDETKKIFV